MSLQKLWTKPLSLHSLVFLLFEVVVAHTVNGGMKISQISLKISFIFVSKTKVRFGVTWGWAINDRNCIFGWTEM